MCGIVGGASRSNVAGDLIASLELLENQGYDAATMLVVSDAKMIERLDTLKKVNDLERQLHEHPLTGKVGIASTNWSGRNTNKKKNTHPHIADGDIGIVTSGLIENGEEIREKLLISGYSLTSNLDCELIGYLVYHYIKAGQSLVNAVRSAEGHLTGTFSAIFIDRVDPKHLIALHRGGSLVLGMNETANYVASDSDSLSVLVKKFVYLEEGDVAEITCSSVVIYDNTGAKVERQMFVADANSGNGTVGKFKHTMLKEIYDQPDIISKTLQGRLNDERVFIDGFGENAHDYFSRIHRVKIVATGTSYHAGLVGRYWMEEIAGIPCLVELASESRYHARMAEPNTLFVTLSQSGESLDTLYALRVAKDMGYTGTLTIGNSPDSTLVHESDLMLITGEGTGKSLTCIKDFTAQLTALSLLSMALGRYHKLNEEIETSKEELQSLNEELIVVNTELQSMIDQLATVNDDMNNLFNSTEIAAFFLDNELCIKRFTPKAQEFIHLIQTDIGRPFSHFSSNIQSGKLIENAAIVLKTLAQKNYDVQSDDQRWYHIRILPYRTLSNMIDGVVITLADITQFKEYESKLKELNASLKDSLAYTENIINTVREPFLVLDADLKIISANQSFYKSFKMQERQTVGSYIYDIAHHQLNIPKLRELLDSVLTKNKTFEDFPLTYDKASKFLLNARIIRHLESGADLILLGLGSE